MKFKALVLGVAAISAVAFTTVKYSNALVMPAQQMKETVKEAQANMAPEFTLPSALGEQVSLSDFAGKTVVLEWVNFDCPYVRKHYDSGNMQNLQKTYTAKDVVWLSINSSAKGKQGQFEEQKLLEKMSEHDHNADHYLVDLSGEVGHKYGAKTTPHMYVIGADGTFVYQGAIDNIPSADKADVEKAENYVAAALDAHLAGKEPAVKSTQPYGCGVKY